MSDKKYLVVYRRFEKVVPKSLRSFVKNSTVEAFEDLPVELDFTGLKMPRDLVAEFTNEVPGLPMFGISSRLSIDNEKDAGEATIYVGAIRAYRLSMNNGLCEKAFPESDASMGSMIANTAIHETAHMLGLDEGGTDSGGHTDDQENVMWDPNTLPKSMTEREPYFVYLVKKGDTLSSLVQKFICGTLVPCRRGSTHLTYQKVWEYPKNKEPGFIGDPKKGANAGRKANNPNWIYPGEMIAFPDHTLRAQTYRRNFSGFLGKKTFTTQQIAAMKKFVEERMKAGLG